MALSKEEKERILKAIEKDREFRYALMGLLGFSEILERITRLEERFARLEERQQRLEERFAELEARFVRLEERQQKLEERFAKLEERVTRLEEKFAELEERFARLEERFARLEEEFLELRKRQQALEERFARLEERFAQLEERFLRLEERVAGLEERFIKLEERVTRLESEVEETKRVVYVIGYRFGVISEAGLREVLKFVVEEVVGAGRVERVILRDEEGLVFGHPSTVEINVAVRDGVHILIEVKARVSRGDVAILHKVGLLYEKLRGVKPRLVIVGGFVDPDAIDLSQRLGVEIRPAIREGYGVRMP